LRCLLFDRSFVTDSHGQSGHSGETAQMFFALATGGSDLSSLYEPPEERPCRGAYGKRRRNSERKVPLKAMGCLIQEFFARFAALLRGMPHSSYAILYRIGNRACRARSLVSRFGDVVSRSLHYSL
jgi:hypothetical protein